MTAKTPKEYAAELREDGEIFDYVSKCLENNIEVTDTICDEVVRAEGATEYLNGLFVRKQQGRKTSCRAFYLKEIDDRRSRRYFHLRPYKRRNARRSENGRFRISVRRRRLRARKILEIINSVPEKSGNSR
ncbi:MAG: hypothetical protein L6V85_04425 [Clostridiales bacterium]|nr:MAG: hypothetical protein L6V85_04425 [Clostridiales bacterium]